MDKRKTFLDNVAGRAGMPGMTDELLKQIQRSIIDAVYTSRHSEAREIRKYHRHYSTKAKARKKVRRRMVAASRRGNK